MLTRSFERALVLLLSKDVFAQLINEQLRCSTTMQTPTTPSVDSGEVNKTIRTDNEDDDEQHFYSAQPSRMFTKMRD